MGSRTRRESGRQAAARPDDRRVVAAGRGGEQAREWRGRRWGKYAGGSGEIGQARTRGQSSKRFGDVAAGKQQAPALHSGGRAAQSQFESFGGSGVHNGRKRSEYSASRSSAVGDIFYFKGLAAIRLKVFVVGFANPSMRTVSCVRPMIILHLESVTASGRDSNVERGR